MSKPKSKLGNNPLVPQGVGAFFADSTQSRPAANTSSGESTQSHTDKTPSGVKRQTVKTLSHLVNKVTQPSPADAELERHTFYLTEAQAQKVKLYALLHQMQISEVIRMLVDGHLKIQP